MIEENKEFINNIILALSKLEERVADLEKVAFRLQDMILDIKYNR